MERKKEKESRNYFTLIGYMEEKCGQYKYRWTEKRMSRYIDK
jgi:hypothetical protein